MEDLESLYTNDVALSSVRENQIPASLLRGLTRQGEYQYKERRQNNGIMDKKKRIVRKGGMANVSFKNVSKKRRRFCSDFYTTLLDASWAFTVFMFFASFYGSWIVFGAIYCLICHLHGDFLDDVEEKHIPCIEELDEFASSFLFSLETQHTIGYGSRQITTECPLAIIVVSIQVTSDNDTHMFVSLL